MHRECFVESTLVFIRCSQMQILIDRYLKNRQFVRYTIKIFRVYAKTAFNIAA